MEENMKNLSTANQVDMTRDGGSSRNIIETGTYTTNPLDGTQTKVGVPSVQLLQRGFIVSADGGGPVDSTEIVDGFRSTSQLPELTSLFKNIGSLYYGKKVYVRELKKYYYYSRGTSISSDSDDTWLPME